MARIPPEQRRSQRAPLLLFDARGLGRTLSHVLLATCAGVAIGCKSQAPPWEQPTGGAPPSMTMTLASSEPEVAAPRASGGRLESGGIFVDCYKGLRATGDPTKDVTRLGLVCGPVEGMRRTLDTPFEGAISAGGAELDFPLALKAGSCYRVFAVSDSEALGLDVAVVSAHGVAVATATSSRGLAVIQPDRPFCALGDEDAVVRVGAKAGSGRFALDVWSIGSP